MSTSCDHFGMDRAAKRKRTARSILDSLAMLKSAALWPVRVLKARREFEMLAGLSETELKDIGLTHSDLGDATALPHSTSPTNFLAARVEERYRARRRA